MNLSPSGRQIDLATHWSRKLRSGSELRIGAILASIQVISRVSTRNSHLPVGDLRSDDKDEHLPRTGTATAFNSKWSGRARVPCLLPNDENRGTKNAHHEDRRYIFSIRSLNIMRISLIPAPPDCHILKADLSATTLTDDYNLLTELRIRHIGEIKHAVFERHIENRRLRTPD